MSYFLKSYKQLNFNWLSDTITRGNEQYFSDNWSKNLIREDEAKSAEWATLVAFGTAPKLTGNFFYFHKVLLISIVWLSFQSFHLSLLRPFGTVSSSELVCTEILEGYHLQLPQTLQKIGLGKTDSIWGVSYTVWCAWQVNNNIP